MVRATPRAEEELHRTLLDIDNLRSDIAFHLLHDSNAGRLRRVLQEWRFELAHHSTAIEGNALLSSDVRALLETRYCAPGCDVVAVNEVIGVDVASPRNGGGGICVWCREWGPMGINAQMNHNLSPISLRPCSPASPSM